MKKLSILLLVIISSLVTNVQAMENIKLVMRKKQERYDEEVRCKSSIENEFGEALEKKNTSDRLLALWMVKFDIDEFLFTYKNQQNGGTEVETIESIREFHLATVLLCPH